MGQVLMQLKWLMQSLMLKSEEQVTEAGVDLEDQMTEAGNAASQKALDAKPGKRRLWQLTRNS
jgi:hypothetical protein